MIWARWAGVMGVPMKWEIARIFVVGTGGSGFCAEAAPSGVIGFFKAVAPYSFLGILLLIVSVFAFLDGAAGCPGGGPKAAIHSGLESALGSHPCVALSSYQASPLYGNVSNGQRTNEPILVEKAVNPGGFGGQSPPS